MVERKNYKKYLIEKKFHAYKTHPGLNALNGIKISNKGIFYRADTLKDLNENEEEIHIDYLYKKYEEWIRKKENTNLAVFELKDNGEGKDIYEIELKNNITTRQAMQIINYLEERYCNQRLPI